MIDVEKNYNFMPYSYTPRGISPVLFYSKLSKEIEMVPRVDITPAVLFLLAIVAPALLPLKFDTKDSVLAIIFKRY